MRASFERWLADLEQRKVGLSPADAAVVDLYIEHLKSERSHDVDRFMAHMSDDVVYRRFGGAVGGRVLTHDEVESGYREMLRGGDWPEYELETDRFVVHPGGIVLDGLLKAVGKGSSFLAQGYTLPEGGTADDEFLMTTRLAAFFTFRDGMMCGEDSYRDPPQLVKLGSGDA